MKFYDAHYLLDSQVSVYAGLKLNSAKNDAYYEYLFINDFHP